MLASAIKTRAGALKKQDRNAVRRAFKPQNWRLIRRSGRKLKHAICAFASIIALGTLLLLGSVAIEQRQASEERAWNDTANLSGAFEEQIGRVLDSVSGAIVLLKPGLAAAEHATFTFGDLTKHLPEFAAIQIAFVGPDGRLKATSLTRTPEPIDLSDREHIRVHLAGGYRGLYIGKPVLGRVSGQPTIQVSERVENARRNAGWRCRFFAFARVPYNASSRGQSRQNGVHDPGRRRRRCPCFVWRMAELGLRLYRDIDIRIESHARFAHAARRLLSRQSSP